MTPFTVVETDVRRLFFLPQNELYWLDISLEKIAMYSVCNMIYKAN